MIEKMVTKFIEITDCSDKYDFTLFGYGIIPFWDVKSAFLNQKRRNRLLSEKLRQKNENAHSNKKCLLFSAFVIQFIC